MESHASDSDVEDDPVVRELDVYVCNEFMGSSTHLCMLHSPLRPPWRPYAYERVSDVRIKPQSRKLEMDIPLDVESRNYNDIIEDFKKVKQVTLRSSFVESKSSLALGTILDGKLLLSPIDYSVHLRPSLDHLNVGKETKRGGAGKGESDDSDDEPEMRAVEVQVQKRETERQQQARLNSYAYITQKEDEEAWVSMKLHTSDSTASENIWERFMSPKDTDLDVSMDRSSYLGAIIPRGNASTASGSAADPVSAAAAAAATVETKVEVKLDEEVLALLNQAVRALFSKHSVCNLDNVRTWLQSQQNLARTVSGLSERSLHETIMAMDIVQNIRRVYVLKSTGNSMTDPFREVVLEVLADKEAFKRSEVTELAIQRKINVTDTLYNRVVKDMCQSRGLQWQLKSGADGV